MPITPSGFVIPIPLILQVCQEYAMAQDLTQIVDFPTRIPDRDDPQTYLLDLFRCSNPDSSLLLLILLWENLTIILLKIRNCFAILVITVRESSKMRGPIKPNNSSLYPISAYRTSFLLEDLQQRS